MKIWVDKDLCTGCELCIETCPYDAIDFVDDIAEIKLKCTVCGACIDCCPVNAILTDEKEIEAVDLSGYKGVWIFVEQKQGTLNKGSMELFSCGSKLAKSLNEELCAILLGDDISDLANRLSVYGAEKIYLAQDTHLKIYQTNAYTKVISDLIIEYKPSIVLYSATHLAVM